MTSTFFSYLPRFKFGVCLLLMASACVFGPGLSRSARAQTAPQADLTVTKSGDEAATVGGTITYNLVVINGGPDDAVNVVLTDPLPAHTTYVGADSSTGGTVTFENNTLTVTFETIPAFESGSATLVVSVNADTPRNTTISNTATGTSDTADPSEENNSSTAQTIITGPFAGDLLIGEFRLRGPGGPGDEFVEVYNNGDTPHTVSAPDGSDGYAVAASDGVVRCTIPNGTIIPPRGHFLCVNSAGYSLAGYPSGAATAAGDATYTTDIPDNSGIALFRTTNPSNFSTVTRLDAAGSTSESNSLYREGTGYPALSGVAYTNGINYSFLRDLCGKGGSTTAPGTCPTLGLPKDTDNNAADFIFVDTAGTSAGAGQRLGAPGPEDLSAPPQRNDQFSLPNLDTTVATSAPPNRVRDFTPVNPNTSSNGTLEIRRRVVNNTGLAVSRLRFRVIDITTFPTPSGFADLRPITSTARLVSGINDTATCAGAGPCTVFVEGTTLEEPPSQPSGGGFNSSLTVDVVTLDTPLQPGESINVRFLLGVQKSGAFRFFVNVEALSFDPNEELRSRSRTGGVVQPRPARQARRR